MTLEELFKLTDLDTVIHTPTGDEYSVELYPNLIRLYSAKNKSHVKIVLSNSLAYQSYNVPGLQPCGYTKEISDQFIKKEESKMKTEFTMPPQTKAISYPRFMLHNSKEYVVLFFNYTSGVVVMSTNQVYKMNFFGTGWNVNDFTPVEGCSVTFSDKN